MRAATPATCRRRHRRAGHPREIRIEARWRQVRVGRPRRHVERRRGHDEVLQLAVVRVGRTTIAAGCGEVDARAVVRIEGKDIRTWRRVNEVPTPAELERPEEVRRSVADTKTTAGRSAGTDATFFPFVRRDSLPAAPTTACLSVSRGSRRDSTPAKRRSDPDPFDRGCLRGSCSRPHIPCSPRRRSLRRADRRTRGSRLPALSERCRRSKTLYAASVE